MPAKTKSIRYVIIAAQIALLGVFAFVLLRHSPHAKAAGTITVNSQADTTADDGVCTLREAIISANTETASGATPGECAAGSGADTINFAITGAADFTNGGQDGYTIQPTSVYPEITSQVTINGYSQPNSAVNTAVAPNPLNGRLLIELNGDNVAAGTALDFGSGSDNSAVRGLVINGFIHGSATNEKDSAGLQIQGNYLGTDYSGTVAKPNATGVNSTGTARGINVLLGGLDPEDRNIISGNTADGNASGGYPASGWIIQGNYIGIAADGTTALGNSFVDGAGGLSIDGADDVVVGGTATGAANVISGNYSHGLAPDQANNLTIQGNYIGTDYTGMIAVPNGGSGITLARSTDVVIGGNSSAARNIIASSGKDGIYAQVMTNITIQGNNIGVGSDGVVALPNTQSAIGLDSSTGIIGGSGAGEGNILANTSNTPFGGYGVNVSDQLGQSHVAILGNSIHDNDDVGIALNSGNPLNDRLDGDSGPNDKLNYPEYISIEESGGDTNIAYYLDAPAGDYRIEFFSNGTLDLSGRGEGQIYLGYADITSPGTGIQTYTKTLSGATGVTNLALTATHKNIEAPSGFDFTSTFGGEGGLATDVSLTKTLVDPNDVAPGATITYSFTIKNEGLAPINLNRYTGQNLGSDNLVLDILPPDLTYVSVAGTNVDCMSAGAGSASFFGPLLGNHSDYALVLCSHDGTSEVLQPGDTKTITINAQVSESSSLHITNYAYIPVTPSQDPDYTSFEAAFNSGNDLIDSLDGVMNNFASAAYAPSNGTVDNTSNGPSVLPSVGAVGGFVALMVATIVAVGFGLRQRRLKS